MINKGYTIILTLTQFRFPAQLLMSPTRPLFPIAVLTWLQRSEFDRLDHSEDVWKRDVVPIQEKSSRLLILHSSGNTGLPKPLIYTNQAMLNNCAQIACTVPYVLKLLAETKAGMEVLRKCERVCCCQSSS
jgi:acyl-CoA synthetase (AMP-forming)/AMP-acid ligase II